MKPELMFISCRRPQFQINANVALSAACGNRLLFANMFPIRTFEGENISDIVSPKKSMNAILLTPVVIAQHHHLHITRINCIILRKLKP